MLHYLFYCLLGIMPENRTVTESYAKRCRILVGVKEPVEKSFNVLAFKSNSLVRMPSCLHHARAAPRTLRSIAVDVVSGLGVAPGAGPLPSVKLLEFFKQKVVHIFEADAAMIEPVYKMPNANKSVICRIRR